MLITIQQLIGCNLGLMFEKRKKPTSRTIGSKSSSRNKITKKQLCQSRQLNFQTIVGQPSVKQVKSKSQYITKEKLSIQKSTQISRGSNSAQFLKKKNSIHFKKSEQKLKNIQSLPNEEHKKKPRIFYEQSQTQKPAEMKWSKKQSLGKKILGRSVERQKLKWDEKRLPYDWETVTELYSSYLTKYEMSQIKQFTKIFYIGHKAKKREKIQFYESGFDNQDKQYNYIQKDHIAYRYQILEMLGKGSYGQVFKVYDHKRKEELALKMIRNKTKFSKQSFIQIKILTYIKEQDPQMLSNIVRIKDFLIFRKHVCLVFQILSENLYELIMRNQYNGLNIQLIRRFAIQILTSLSFLAHHKIIHGDLKPQNILLRQYSKSGIKIIDFGSSCFEHQILYTYIQSRYYRAPEITLGIKYDNKIDIWSTGCILSQLFTGVPLFPGQNQLDQMKYLVDTLGVPNKQLLSRGSRSQIFFNPEGELKSNIAEMKSVEHFSKKLQERIGDQGFRKFVVKFLKWDPKERTTAAQALKDPWIISGLPEELRNNLSANQNHHHIKKQGCKSLEKNIKNSKGKINKLKKV